MTTKLDKWPRLLLLGAAVFTIILCGAVLLLVLNNSNAGPGLTTNFCMGWSATPRFQAGIAWVSPLSSYMPPLMMSRYKVCMDLPPGLAPRRINGEFMLPP